MIYKCDIPNTVIADTEKECKQAIFDLVGPNWDPVDKKRKIIHYGLFNLRQKYVMQMTYSQDFTTKNFQRTIELQKEEDQLERNRQALLVNTQMTQVTQQLKEMTERLNTLTNASPEKHESIKRIEELLEQNEFNHSFIEYINERIRNEFSLDQLENFDLVERKVVDWIGETISIAKTRVFRPPHVVIIVGPTGVGKTTTLVKLAAQYMMSCKHEGRKAEICFITTDSMRVGAMEQLSRFGQILNYKVLKAENSEDLKVLYDENRNLMDAIFIDTSGYSPNDATHIGGLKALLDIPGMNPDIYLAMTASTKASDLKNIMKNYEPFGYDSIIITKCDESEQYGNVISMLYENHKSISYITNGQIASKNIVKANVIDFLIRLDGFNVDRKHIEDKFGEK